MLIEGGTFLMGSPVTELERDGDEVLHSVTVSDFYMAAMGVTQVVRGRDILFSTPKQILLLRLLGKRVPAQYAHIPLC